MSATFVFCVQDRSGTAAQLTMAEAPLNVVDIGDTGTYSGFDYNGKTISLDFTVGQVFDALNFGITTITPDGGPGNVLQSGWPASGTITWTGGTNAVGGAPGLDGNTDFTLFATNASGIVASGPLTSVQADDVILVFVMAYDAVAYRPVSSVSGGGLTWHFRARQQMTTGGYFVNVEEWWAASPAAANGLVVSAELTGEADYAWVDAIAVSGVNTTTPFDTNTDLPVKASGTNSTPDASISTTQSPTFIVELLGGVNNSPALGAGMTQIGRAAANIVIGTQIGSAPESPGLTLGGTSSLPDWFILADALQASGTGGATVITDRNPANAYTTVEYFMKYCNSRGYPYPASPVDEIQQAIVQATDYIDQRYRFKGIKLLQFLNNGNFDPSIGFLDPWLGEMGFLGGGPGTNFEAWFTPSTTSQRTQWPRQGVVDFDGDTVYGVPMAVQQATCEGALRVLNGTSLQPDYDPAIVTAGGVVSSLSVEVGPIRKTTSYDTKLGLSFFPDIPHIRRMLSQAGLLLAGGGRTIIL